MLYSELWFENMALGKKCRVVKSRPSAADAEHKGPGLGFVKYTRGWGRKRILISNDIEDEVPSLDLTVKTPLKRQGSEKLIMSSDSRRSPLESLPHEILVRILCGVDHEDLKRLFHVSKVIREATLIVKKLHFAYKTPTKTQAFRTPLDFVESNDVDEIEAPKAPIQTRSFRSRLSRKTLSNISVALFP